METDGDFIYGVHLTDSSSESSSSDDEEQPALLGDEDDELDPDLRPIYEGAPLTIRESNTIIFTLIANHCIAGSLLSDILKILEMHCPKPNYCPKSLYLFRKYFSNHKTVIEKKFYCKFCMFLLKIEKLDNNENCVCSNCH